jgi:hypothetical protein
MKLIFCPHCQDVRRLAQAFVNCDCGSSGGLYLTDGKRALISGDAIPFGFDNEHLIAALGASMRNNMADKGSKAFSAFAISLPCSTIRRITVTPGQPFDIEAAWDGAK